MKQLLLIFSMFTFTSIHAQPRVVTFDSEQKETTSRIESNAIKLHPFEFISGDFSIYYEKSFFDKISAEAGIGFTFGDDFGNYNSDHTKVFVDNKLGTSFSVSLRIYPTEVFEEFYISPEYKYRRYNWEADFAEYPESMYGVTNKVEEYRVYSMPRLTFGYVFYFLTNITIDIHLGVGINSPKELRYNEETLQTEKHTLNSRPRANGGIKIAYVF